MTAPAFDPATGLLTAPRDAIADLARLRTGAAPVDEDRLDAVLSEAGAGTLREPHPRLAQALLALERPIVGLMIGKTGYGMPGWIGEGVFALHVFRGLDGADDQLVSMPADHMAHFLVWLLSIGPRPGADRQGETTVDLDTLNRAIALRLGDRPSAGLLPEPLDGSVAERFRDWWMATARWPPAEGAPYNIALEVIDTDDGLWSVQRREDGRAVVRPVAPAQTFIGLGELIPDGDLVDQSAPRLPVEVTPVDGGPVAWVAEVLAESPGPGRA
jgi:hypothetical protein